MSHRPGGDWISRGVGLRLAVAAAMSALVWLGFFWATGGGLGA